MERLRDEYPALQRTIRGQPLIYFDSAATALKPRAVIHAITSFLSSSGASVHRAVHQLGVEASEAYEGARDIIASFLGADVDEVVYVRNTTEGINLVARSLKPSSSVLITGMEHHSNVLPWRKLHRPTVVPVLPDGTVDEQQILAEIRKGHDLVAICQVSNVLGVLNPVERIVEAAHAAGSKVLVDGAQGAPHLEVDVHALGCDYYAMSGHKLGGPTGIGVLYAKREHLQEMQPLLWGGDMVSAVHIEGEQLQEPPLRFEAGTPAVEAAIGLGAACEFLEDVGRDRILEHDRALASHARKGLAALERVVIHGPADSARSAGTVAFTIDGIGSNMVAKVLSDRINACVRSGWLCAQPLHEALELEPTVRASFYLYNTEDEVDRMLSVLEDLIGTA